MIDYRTLWDHEARTDERYAARRWGGDGSPEQVDPTIAAILANLDYVHTYAGGRTLNLTPSVMEIGCGPGRLLEPFARANPGSHFYGVDVSPVMLDLWPADRRPTNVTLGPVGMGDGCESIDFVYSVEVFQHLDRDEKARCLDRIRGMLSPMGVAVVQYVVGDWSETAWDHPASEALMIRMVAAARMAVLLPLRNTLCSVHDEWRWMVMTK